MEIEGSDAQMYVLRPLVALADNNRSVTACPAHIVVVLCVAFIPLTSRKKGEVDQLPNVEATL